MYLKQINFTRFVAAIIVVVFHYGANIKPFQNVVIQKVIQTGNLFVIYFFLLSGFILSIAYFEKIEKISYSKFVFLRLSRIYPAFLLSILISLLFLYSQNYPFQPILLCKILSLTHGWVNPWVEESGQLLNPPAWTLSLEFCFYLLFPLLFKCLNKLNTIRLNLIILACFCYNFLIQTQLLMLYDFLNKYAPQPFLFVHIFILGAAMGLLFARKYPINIITHNHFYVLLLSVLVAILMIFYANITMWNSTFMVGIFAFFIWHLAIDSSWFTVVFSNKYLVLLGDISFGVYILQAPVKNMYDKLLDHFGFNYPTMYFYFYLIVLLAIAYLSFVFIEKPFQIWVKSKFTKSKLTT